MKPIVTSILSATLLLLSLTCQAQCLFSTGANISTSSALDFTLGESVTEYTAPAAIGFLPSMHYSFVSSEKQLTDSIAIQVHFDNELQQATVFMTYDLTQHHPTYQVCGIDGMVHLQGKITTMPHFIGYSQLPSGIYILHISGIPGRIPHTTRWLKL